MFAAALALFGGFLAQGDGGVPSLVGPLWFRLLLTGEELNGEFVDGVAKLVALGVGGQPGHSALNHENPKLA